MNDCSKRQNFQNISDQIAYPSKRLLSSVAFVSLQKLPRSCLMYVSWMIKLSFTFCTVTQLCKGDKKRDLSGESELRF